MAFGDTFGHYVIGDILKKWTRLSSGTTGSSLSAGTGPSGVATLRITNDNYGVYRSVPQSPTYYLHFWLKSDTVPSGQNSVAAFADSSGQTHTFLVINSDGSLSVYKETSLSTSDHVGIGMPTGTLLVQSAAGLFTANTLHHFQFGTTVHASSGVATVKFNGVTVASFSGNTKNANASATGEITQFGIGGNFISAVGDFASVLIVASAFKGSVVGYPLWTTAEGATIEWTPSTGTDNEANIDDATPDGDTTYNSAAGVATDTFTHQASPVAGAPIRAVQLVWSVEKTDAGACTVAPVIRHSGTDYVGTDQSPANGTYNFHSQLYEQNPGTAATFTESGFNDTEIGPKRTA